MQTSSPQTSWLDIRGKHNYGNVSQNNRTKAVLVVPLTCVSFLGLLTICPSKRVESWWADSIWNLTADWKVISWKKLTSWSAISFSDAFEDLISAWVEAWVLKRMTTINKIKFCLIQTYSNQRACPLVLKLLPWGLISMDDCFQPLP